MSALDSYSRGRPYLQLGQLHLGDLQVGDHHLSHNQNPVFKFREPRTMFQE